MSLDQLRKRIQELREKGLLGSGYTAPELPGMGDPYQSQSSANSSRNAVDNTEILGYTPVKTTGNNSAGITSPNVYVPNMGVAPNADTAGSNSNTRNNSTSGNNSITPYQISDSEKELNYMMDMLFMNGAGSSSVPIVQMAYEWVSNPDNKSKPIPKDVLDTYYAFMGGADDKQIAGSNHIAVGKDDEIGLVDEIYKVKAANQQSTDASKSDSPYYPQAKNTSPVSSSLSDFVKSADSTKQSSNETVPLGKAGQTALGEIIKPNPDVFGTRSGYLYQAYQEGLNGLDFSRELRADAAAGNFLDEIEKMYKAGETDAMIAKGDALVNGDIPQLKPVDAEVPYMGYAEYGQGEDENDDLNWDRDYNYMEDMLFLNGAESSSDLNARRVYEYFSNYENRGRQIPEDIMQAYKNFMIGISKGDIGCQNTTQLMRDEQRRRSHKIAIGDADIDDFTYDELKTRNDLFPSNTSGDGNNDRIIMPAIGKEWKNDYPNYASSGDPHVGRDLSKEGTAVALGKMTVVGTYAVTDEIVTKNDNTYYTNKLRNGFGNCVIFVMEYKGEQYFIIYGHLAEKPDLEAGQVLLPGEEIGTIGSTGNSSGTHLHISVIKNGQYIDPLVLFGGDINEDYSDARSNVAKGKMLEIINNYTKEHGK